MSVFWTLFAVALLWGGLAQGVRPLRYLGLALFAVVVGKVFVVDLREMEIIYRVVAILVLGVALLLGAFAYLRMAGRFEQHGGGEKDSEQ